MIKCKNYFNSGFTLVELLLAMGILAFIATTSVVVIGNFNKTQNIDIGYDDLHTAIAQTKSYALSQVVETCDVNNIDQNSREELIGYEIRFNTVSNEYTIHEICQSNATLIERSTLINTDELPRSIVFNSAPAAIRFKVLTGGTSLASNQIITIDTEDGGNQRMITVTPGGKIIQDE